MAVLGFCLGLGLRMSQDKNSTGGVNDFQSTVSAVGVVVVIVALSKAEGAAAANYFFSSLFFNNSTRKNSPYFRRNPSSCSRVVWR